MVKKLIEGFLKKKPEAKDSKAESATDEVPDELPPLGEDSVQAAAASATESTSPKDDEPPEELPSIEEKPPEVVDVRPSPRREQDDEASAQPEEDEGKELAAAPADMHETQKGQQPLATAGDGFFANLSRLLKGGKPADSLLSHDLLANMKDSWGIRKEASKTGMSSSDEKRVSTAIDETLSQLRLMEGKWKAHRMMLDEYERLTQEQEDKMREKEKELKALLRRQKLYQQAPEGRVIMLKGTIPIRCISELVNALRTMDASTFNSFVNAKKNDFSGFASTIDKRLGDDLRKASTKEGTLKVLDRFVKRLSE